MGVISFNPLKPGEGMNPQVQPQSITWASLKEIRDAGGLIPGQFYRITDFVTTTMETDTRSAGHPFDIIVRADDKAVLNEQAWAVKRTGDTYFGNSDLAAWELKYSLDNVQWSAIKGTYCIEGNDEYSLLKVGTINIEGTDYILWKCSQDLIDDYEVAWAVSADEEIGTELDKYDPESGEILSEDWSSTISSISVIEEDGKGTITFMKDEFGNECPYDFKNIQFKRWKVTDAMTDRTGFTDTYLGVLDYTPSKLSVEDETDFLWAYTFSSDATGGAQEDYSLGGHDVFENIIKPYQYGLPNNVMFGEYNYQNSFSQGCSGNSFSQGCYQNSFSQNCQNNSFSQGCNRNSFSQGCSDNSFSQGCSRNSFSQGCYQNSFSQNCQNNSFSQYCSRNSFSQGCYNNSFSQDCNQNSFSQNCQNNSFSQNCQNNSFSQNCQNNSFSQGCYHNSFSQNVNNVKLDTAYMVNFVVGAGNQYITLTCSASPTAQQPCKNVKINMGVNSSTTNKAISITTKNQAYQTVVASENDALVEV